MDIKKIIKNSGYTISDVAAKMRRQDGGVGLPQSALSQIIINGNPSFLKLKEIANIIGVPVSVLVAEPSDESITGIINYNGRAMQANNLSELQSIIDNIKKDIEQKK